MSSGVSFGLVCVLGTWTLLGFAPSAFAEGATGAHAPTQSPSVVRAQAPGKEPAKEPAEDESARQIRLGALFTLKAGSTVRISEKDIRVAGPGRDLDGFWKGHKEYEPYRKLAKETGGIVTIGPAGRIHPMFSLFLDRAQGTMYHGNPEVDVAIAVDTTGSMGSTLKGVVDSLKDLSGRVSKMHGEGVRTRLAVIGYRDKGDEYVTKVFQNFTYSMDRVGTQWKKLQAGGGGDAPEAAYDAILTSINELSWRKGAPTTNRFLVLITDAPPHATTLDGRSDLDAIIRRLREENITVYPIIVGQ